MSISFYFEIPLHVGGYVQSQLKSPGRLCSSTNNRDYRKDWKRNYKTRGCRETVTNHEGQYCGKS